MPQPNPAANGAHAATPRTSGGVRAAPGNSLARPNGAAWFTRSAVAGTCSAAAAGHRADRVRRAAGMVLALLCISRASAADLLYRQDPANDDAFLGSSWHAPDGSEEDQFAWDDFRLERAATLTEIRWQGGYAVGAESAPVDGFTISLFASAEGDLQPDLRGSALALYSIPGNAGETAVGTAGGAQLFDYRYTLAKPFAAKAGTTYWLQIEASQRGTPTWGLARATTGNDRHFRKLATGADPYYQTVQGDAAFELSGTAVADRPPAPPPAQAAPPAPPPAQAAPR